MRVIVDTNVLVSGLISPRGSPARIVDAVLAGRIIPVMSVATFAELEDVLHRPGIRGYLAKNGISPFAILAELARLAHVVKPRLSTVRIRDPKDKPFVELAASRPAADFIVTGDKDFTESRYGDVPVISAREFVDKVLRR